jgi:hypothetical protein
MNSSTGNALPVFFTSSVSPAIAIDNVTNGTSDDIDFGERFPSLGDYDFLFTDHMTLMSGSLRRINFTSMLVVFDLPISCPCIDLLYKNDTMLSHM